MNKVLETERFYLRELKVTDAQMFYALNLDPEVTRYTGDTSFHSISEAMEFLENYDHYEKYGYGRWAIIDKEKGACWGWCGLKKRVDGNIDMGYRLFQSKWGKGCATEVGVACIQFAFETLKLPEIIAEAVTENKASFRVMERMGFEFWKASEDHGMETQVYKLTREDYLKKD